MDATKAAQLVSVELELDNGKHKTVKMSHKDAMNLVRQCNRQKVTGYEYRNEHGQVTTLMLAHVVECVIVEGDPSARAPKPAATAAGNTAGGIGKLSPAPKAATPAPKPTPAPTPTPTPTPAAGDDAAAGAAAGTEGNASEQGAA